MAADLGGQPAPDPQVPLQPRIPEVQVAVAEAEFFRDPLGIGRRERRSPRLAEHMDALGLDLDRPGLNSPVDRFRFPSEHHPLDGDHPPGSETLRLRRRPGLGADHDLGHPAVVAEVEEEEPAEIPDALHPAHQDDAVARVLEIERRAVVGGTGGNAHGTGLRHQLRRGSPLPAR